MSRRVIGPGNSCQEYRRRKIECSRSMPCSYCAKKEVECVYPVPSTSRFPKSPASAVDGDILARIEAVERTLLTFELELSHLRHANPTPPSSSYSAPGDSIPAEQMRHGFDSLDTLATQVVIPFLPLKARDRTITSMIGELRIHHSQPINQPMNHASAKVAYSRIQPHSTWPAQIWAKAMTCLSRIVIRTSCCGPKP